MNLMPQTVSAKDIQRNYRSVFNLAKKTKKPVVVITNNQPDVAIIDVKEYDRLQQRLEEFETQEALQAIKKAKQAEQEGSLINANSLADLT